MTPTLQQAMQRNVVLLDGGLATELERQGHDLSSALWSARLLRDDPGAIVAAHLAYFRAGARVATSASYQASFQGFAAAGLDADEAAQLLRLSVALAASGRQQADAEHPDPRGRFVAASVGPYGATLADGSEYHGRYGKTVAELRAFHRPRLQLLAEAGPDVLAVETIPSLAEAEAVLAELDGLGRPAWLALSCEGRRLRSGEPAEDAFAMARDVDAVVAVGVNCTAPGDVGSLVPLAAARSGRPVVVYPNSGEGWDAVGRCWTGNPRLDPLDVAGWVRDGARLVGGCCRVGPAEIAALAGQLAAET